MDTLQNVSVKIVNYKCFGEEGAGFEQILPINLIIGRNNSGKSSLLDLISYATSYPRGVSLDGYSHKGQSPHLLYTEFLEAEELIQFFKHIFRDEYDFRIWWKHTGHTWVGKSMTREILNADVNRKFVSVSQPFPDPFAHQEEILIRIKPFPFNDYTFKRLSPDRDVQQETDGGSIPSDPIQPNGQGASNLLHSYLNKAHLPSELVTETLLNAMNEVFEPDGTFTEIVTQQHNDGPWEIFLREERKGRVPISRTGHGVKTILLVLTFLYLVPHIEQKSLKNYLFGFEELENNLHPALFRRLLLYLRKVAEEGCKFFLTTHSSVAIDMFANDEQAQIIHVTHNGECATAKPVLTHKDRRGILDDLDVRASDLLQANGIVWVEGPSDRLYFNRWIELVSNGALREGAHYQCVFYGGKLLKHFTTDEFEEAINILNVNRNAILLMDSDRQYANAPINETKKRLIAEFKQMDAMAWLTKGREIENYLPMEALRDLFPDREVAEFGSYASFAEYYENLSPSQRKRTSNCKTPFDKVEFAQRILPSLTVENIQSCLDLYDRIQEACNHIRRWNSIRT